MTDTKFVNNFFNEMEKKYKEETGKTQMQNTADLFYFFDWIAKQLKTMNPERTLSEMLDEMKKQNTAF